MGKHTPGPWKACGDSKCKCRQIWSIPGDCPVFTARSTGQIAMVGLAHHKWGDSPELIYGEIDQESTEANARLIAAAPDGYEALIELDSVVSELLQAIPEIEIGAPLAIRLMEARKGTGAAIAKATEGE